jgi:hypothetical protein
MSNITHSEKRALKKELLVLFKELSVYRNNGRYSEYEIGICSKLKNAVCALFIDYEADSVRVPIAIDIADNCFKRACKSWNKYSGNCAFPVPSRISEEEAYYNFKKWGNSKYADDRRNLAKHCFQYFEENFYPEIEIKL